MHTTENTAIQVARAQAGDIESFDCLVRCWQDRAVGYAQRLLGNRPDAEDAAQDAFVQFWYDLPHLRDVDAAEGYLRRIVFKYCDRIRRRRKATTVPLDFAATVGGGGDPLDLLLENEQQQIIQRALAALPTAQRCIASLRYMQGLSLAEIATQVQLPVGTIKNRLHAARKRLRKELWEMADGPLNKPKPSESPDFVGQVIAKILIAFEHQMWNDPHLADRASLHEAKSLLDERLQKAPPPDFTTTRYGFEVLLRLDDWKAAAALLLRFLDGSATDSETVWAHLHLGNSLAVAKEPLGAVLAHQAFERWVPGKQIRLSAAWPHPPIAEGETPAFTREEVRLLYLCHSAEFATAYLNAGRLAEYLHLLDERMAGAPTHVGRLDFRALRMAAQVCRNAEEFARAQKYIDRMYRQSETVADPYEQAIRRLNTYTDHLNLLRAQNKKDDFIAVSKQMTELLAKMSGEREDETGETGYLRHNLAHQITLYGMYDKALPLWEENERMGLGQVNGWGYLLYAATVWKQTGDRDRTLNLLRDAAVTDNRDVTALFHERPEFADVWSDADFIAATKKG